MGKKQTIINFSRRIIHTNSIIFYTSFFYHRKDKHPEFCKLIQKKMQYCGRALKKSLCNRHQRAAFALHN